ncbi:META domain-containing protein [Herbiconiux sp. 11R-BC]|uniref:META domain-containing protein n=1 Tax=Herbiconiux sp. 11R-BC TaxID=3111637 RepID=UPI003C01BA11
MGIARGRRRVLGLAAALATAASLVLAGCAGGSAHPAGEAAPAATNDVVGVWVTGESYASPQVPYLDFASDGSWTGSDGCNGAQGDWSVDSSGMLSVTAGAQTLIGCDGVALPGILSQAGMALRQGEELILADTDGKAMITLMPAPAGTVPTAAPTP